MNCTYCNKETTNKKFCSRSCSSTHNNKIFPKRKAKFRTCRDCKLKYHPSQMSVYRCLSCLEKIREKRTKFLKMTMKDVREKYKETGIHRSWWFSEIRALARKMNANRKQECQVCHYDKHVECAHIISLSKADDSITIEQLNSEKNILLLCPNHHWEFDHGFVKM